MSIAERLRHKISAQHHANHQIKGHWRSVSLCLDEDAAEFLNVGVVFIYGDKQVEVRMLDSFDRVKCLYDSRVDYNDLSRLMMDVEAAIYDLRTDLPDHLGDAIRLGPPLYAAGASASDVVDDFFSDIVTLARPRGGSPEVAFRYQSTPKIRSSVFDMMKQRMQLKASRIIQEDRFQLKLRSGHRIEMDVPLLSEQASGTIISAWYKSPMVVENNLLRASADLNLIRSNTDRDQAAISVLVPKSESGLTDAEFKKLDTATRQLINKIKATGIEVLESDNSGDLADLTVSWWRERCA
jgi:hypothetical protein